MKKLEGTGVALVTPFKEDRSIDFDGLTRLLEHVIKGGVDYLVVLGTTGETATMDTAEKDAVLDHVKQVNQSRLPIVLGIGGNNTAALLNEFKRVDLNGVTAILSASPYYNKPTQEGIYQHYKSLSEHSPLPIILYNVPGRTASNISAETTLRLANDCENIIAIKEASADMAQVMQIIKDRPEGFLVISGEDALTYPIITCGGEGVISVVANSQPKLFANMVRAARKANLDEAREKHYDLYDFINLLFMEGNPGGIKAALNAQQICADYMRLPLWQISNKLKNQIELSLQDLS